LATSVRVHGLQAALGSGVLFVVTHTASNPSLLKHRSILQAA
jgi:hypothetical protein